MIACVFIPDFAVVVARAYHGVSPDWPLIVAKYTKHRGKVFAVSPQARLRGVKPGMAAHRGLALCPQAMLVDLVESPQRRAGDALLEALSPFSNRLELESNHTSTIWLDLGNMPDAEALDMARQIKETVIGQSLFLPAVGLAGGKFPARIAAVLAGEGGIKLVSAGDEEAFLAPFPVARLALTQKQLKQFKLLGIETLGQVAALPANGLQEQFGDVGKRLHALALGINPQPVATYVPQIKQYREQQFEPAIEDSSVLDGVLQKLAGELATYMVSKGLATQDIVLTLHLDNKLVLEACFTPREPIASQMSVYTNLVRLLDGMTISTAVRALEVGVENLKPPVPKQLDFFGQMFADPRNITEIVDQLVPRYGIAPFQQISINPYGGVVPERWFRFKGVA